MSGTRTAGHVSHFVNRRTIAAMGVVGIALGFTVRGVVAQAEDEAPRLALTTQSEAAEQHFWAGVTDALNVYAPRAAQHFEMALEADPGLGLAIVLHGFTEPGLTDAEREERIAEGIAALGPASSNEMLVGLAIKEWSSGNAPAASRMFELASTLLPGDPYLASWATQLAGARGDTRDVIDRWEALMEAFPELANPHNSLAYQRFGRGDEAGGLASVRRYVELAPQHPNAADSHAELLQWTGRYPEAYAEYMRAAELDPDYSQAYMGVAEVLVLVGAGDAAREALGQAVEHAPSPAARVTAMRAIANSHMIDGARDAVMGQLEQASTEAEAAGLDGAHALVREQMAMADAVMGDGRFIAEYLEEAGAIRGSETALHLGMAGLAYAASGQGVMAREASAGLADDGPFWESIGRAIDALVSLDEGDAQAALDGLQKADPADPVVQAVMAEAYDRLERPGAAAALRQRVLGNRQIAVANPFWAFAYARVRTD